MRMISNFGSHIDFKFQYLFSIMISCLILRIAVILQFNESIGPLIKIVGKMAMDFYNFILLYVILTVMFSIVGKMNFIFYLVEYEGFLQSILTVVDASLGNYKFTIFDVVPDDNLKLLG